MLTYLISKVATDGFLLLKGKLVVRDQYKKFYVVDVIRNTCENKVIFEDQKNGTKHVIFYPDIFIIPFKLSMYF